MATYVVTFAEGIEEKIEAKEDLLAEGVLILTGVRPHRIIPIAQIRMVKIYESA